VISRPHSPIRLRWRKRHQKALRTIVRLSHTQLVMGNRRITLCEVSVCTDASAIRRSVQQRSPSSRPNAYDSNFRLNAHSTDRPAVTLGEPCGDRRQTMRLEWPTIGWGMALRDPTMIRRSSGISAWGRSSDRHLHPRSRFPTRRLSRTIIWRDDVEGRPVSGSVSRKRLGP
jgi:hypothetical protein